MTETVEASDGASAPAAAAATTRRRKTGGGLEGMLLPELKQLAGTLGIKGTGALRKGQLIEAIKAAQGGGGTTGGGSRARSSQPTLDEATTEPAPSAKSAAPEAPVREGSRRARAAAAGTAVEQNGAAATGAAQTTPELQTSAPQTSGGQTSAGQTAPAAQNGGADTAPAAQNGTADRADEREGRSEDRGRGRGRENQARDGQSRDGQAREGQARDGQTREAGRESQGRDGGREQARDGRDGQARDGVRDRDGQNRDGGREQSRDGGREQREQGRDAGREQARDGRDGGNRDRDGRDRDGRDRDGQARDGQRDQRGNRADGRADGRTDTRIDSRADDRGEEGDGRRRRRRGRDRDRNRDGRDGRDTGRDAGRSRGRGERFDPEPTISEDDVLVPAAGILDVLDNYAFVRTSGYLPGPNDVYVALSMVKRSGLRKGDAITGAVKQPSDGERKEKFNPLVRIDTVNGSDPEIAKQRQDFNKLTPLYATERLRLETEPNILTTRIVDIVSPIGKGQRGLIVSPPKAGKTMVLQALANAITTNNPEVHLMVVLVDERPEEVTDMQRTVKGEVIASTFDRPADDHTTVAELAIERAKRLVELGHDVVVLLDSITRLGRAYNIAAPASGRILSGGVDSSALYPPKRFFGAARNIEDGGSLTILATALIETGSKMDEVIFEEFKGTGNMELRLRREFADRRIFPAIDVVASGTRREELLMSKDETQVVWKLRRVLSALDGQAALELLIGKLKESKSNIEFLLQVNKTTPSAGGRNTDDGN
ncbi:transcription termination factor Rho [Kribbella flavida DSM 17836]|uniref:Transcription termination factor Rho n=1 Tax=Kribbella flavida (strain DSM 17836 / JCM 10339 / NBRC 14399) TaxID=479435 RepID=D2Q3F6_KRIFD|nr:transcription termination factor Rho [Kribbella flavida]ADB34079.1 transcription termination factor Rho [Kribbella flavida DSM 17836]